jgi:lipopolysaccharide export system protein LptC
MARLFGMSVSAKSLWMRTRLHWDQLAVYVPLLLMGLLALATYWLVRNTPVVKDAALVSAPQHLPDYFMRDFSVKVFDAHGKLKNEMAGVQGRHYPDTDTVEIDQPRIRAIAPDGRVTTARAGRAVINADGSEVQLFDKAVLIREAVPSGSTSSQLRSELRGEFFHLFANAEKIRTHLPVEMQRGTGDRLVADRLDFDNLDRVLHLDGRVRVTLAARALKP